VTRVTSTLAPTRPAFAEAFPRTPELDALVDAFTAGNYRLVRTEAPKLAAKTDDPKVKDAANELRSRIDADPWAVALVVMTGLLLCFLGVYWLFNDGRHAPPPPSPKAPVEIIR
jgi:hypothetical protein